jgi:protein SCO1
MYTVRNRLIRLGVAAAAALALAACGQSSRTSGQTATSSGEALVGGPFQLVDQNGRAIDQNLLKGKWSAVFFGYTNCPDACPTTLFALAGAEKQLGAKAAGFQTVFISVDPARDDAKKLASYLSNSAFPKHSLGLTGTPAQVAEAARAYHVFYQTAPDANDPKNYSVNHSTYTYLMNPKGRFTCVIPFNASPEEIAGHVQKAMAQGDGAESC